MSSLLNYLNYVNKKDDCQMFNLYTPQTPARHRPFQRHPFHKVSVPLPNDPYLSLPVWSGPGGQHHSATISRKSSWQSGALGSCPALQAPSPWLCNISGQIDPRGNLLAKVLSRLQDLPTARWPPTKFSIAFWPGNRFSCRTKLTYWKSMK